MDTDEILQVIEVAEIIVPRFKALGDDQIEESPGDFDGRRPGGRGARTEATRAPTWSASSVRLPTGVDIGCRRTPSWRTRSTRSMAPRIKGSPRYAVMVAEVRRGETTTWIYAGDRTRLRRRVPGAGRCNGERSAVARAGAARDDQQTLLALPRCPRRT